MELKFKKQKETKVIYYIEYLTGILSNFIVIVNQIMMLNF